MAVEMAAIGVDLFGLEAEAADRRRVFPFELAGEKDDEVRGGIDRS
jgi:hypothetical protein